MRIINVRISNESKNPDPDYAKKGDHGCDVRASMPHTKENCDKRLGFEWVYNPHANIAIIRPGGRALIGTGLFCEIPEGYGISIRPRSGLALKSGVTIGNSPGTIDAGYRNEIGVILINHSNEEFIVHEGDRIAQFVIEEALQICWVPVDSKEALASSDRGLGGFGSTGS